MLQLSETDKLIFDLSEKLHTLMASQSERLFAENFLKRITSCNSFCQLKCYLLPFITWLDHSILRELVEASGYDSAKAMLDNFSMIDDSEPIGSYSIPAPGQLILPLNDSKYTLIATKHGSNNMSLKQVKTIKSIMEQKWKITSHAIQLASACTKSGFLYWMIPESIVTLIETSLKQMRHELWQCGFIMITLLPVNFCDQDTCYVEDITSPFCFAEQSSIEVCMYVHTNYKCMHFNIHSIRTCTCV